MSDAPERIWAFYAPHIAEDENGATIVAHETVQHGAAEYVRANMQPTVSPELLATTHDVAALERILRERGAVFDAMVDAAEDAAGKDVSFNVVIGRALRAALARVKGVV